MTENQPENENEAPADLSRNDTEKLRGTQFSTDDLMMLMDGNFVEWKVPSNQREQMEDALEEFIPKKTGFS